MKNLPSKYQKNITDLLNLGSEGSVKRIERREGRVEKFQDCSIISFSSNLVNQHDDVAEKIYNALVADGNITRFCEVKNEFKHRSHLPESKGLEHITGDITFNFPVRTGLNGLHRIFFILSYNESSQPCEGGELVSTEYILRVEPSSGAFAFRNSKHNFRSEVKEEELSVTAVHEAKRILKTFGFFDINIGHVELIRSMERGKRTYAELTIMPNLEKYSGEKEESIIYSFEGLEKKIDYFIQNEILHWRQTPKVDLKEEMVGNCYFNFYTYGHRKGIRCIWIGSSTHNLEDYLGRLVESVDDYLVAMENSITSLKKERAETLGNEKYAGQTKFYDDWINRVVSHLMGFGITALDFGDKVTAQKVNTIIREAAGGSLPMMVESLGAKYLE